MPFEVPSSWVWTTLGEICFFENGYAFSSDDYANSGIPLIRISNIKDNQISTENCVYIQGEYEDKFHICNGDLLIAMSGATTGKMGVYLSNKKAYLNQRVGNIKVIDSLSLCLEYRNFFLQSKSEEILKLAYGGAQPNISGAMISSLQVPLPPISEQQRIVSEIERWFALIDQIEQGKADLQTIIKQAKSKILDLAIHGKLVPQNPNDEPASELLKRINSKAEITCDNGQYGKLPRSWSVTILGNLFEHNTGKALNSSNNEGVMLQYLTTSNVYWDTFDLSVIKQMLFKDSELERCTVRKGDLLVCEGGDVGRAAIWDYDYNICIQNHLHRLRPKIDLSVRFYLYVLKYLKDNNMIGGKGIGLLGLSTNELHKLLFPLPPLAEQYRIVAKIEELFSKLDLIEKSLEA